MKKYDNFHSHLGILKKAHKEDLNNEFIISGIIDKFFIQFELGWKVLKELLKYEGNSHGLSGSPREIIKNAYYCFDFIDEEIWLKMLRDRNDCTHIYSHQMANELVGKIIHIYVPEFDKVDKAIYTHYGNIINDEQR